MSDSNWIKLNRKIWDNFIWSFEEPKYAMAWVDMLLMANYKDKKIMFDGSVITVQRGSFISSIAKLADRWCMNKRTVKRFLDMLQSDGMISYKCTNRCTTVFICNYNAFQDFSGESCTAECTPDYTAECTPDYTAECTQHKKEKKIKKGKERKESVEESTPALFERLLPDYSLSDLIKTKMGEWITYKTQRNETYQEQGMKSLLTQIQKNTAKYGEQAMCDLIDECMASGWKGIIFDRLKPKDPVPQPPSRGGRKEMVPGWMNKSTQPSAESIKESSDWLDKFMAEQEQAAKAAELAERAERLKQEFAKPKGENTA